MICILADFSARLRIIIKVSELAGDICPSMTCEALQIGIKREVILFQSLQMLIYCSICACHTSHISQEQCLHLTATCLKCKVADPTETEGLKGATAMKQEEHMKFPTFQDSASLQFSRWRNMDMSGEQNCSRGIAKETMERLLKPTPVTP